VTNTSLWLAALMITSCAITGVHASGTVHGEPFSSELAEGTYCEHCSGGVRVFVRLARHPATTVSNAHGQLVMDFPSCLPGDYGLGSDQLQGMYYYPGEGGGAGRSVDCVKGEIRVLQCSETHVQLRFWCEFPDGSAVKGAVATDLKYDLGYD